MTDKKDLAIIILAAGNSSRMGKPKQMLPVRGVTLLEHTVNCAIYSGISSIFVVLGSNAAEHQSVLKDKSVTVIVNPEWSLGMGTSLKFGIRNLMEKNPNAQAVILLVCDQPLLTGNHINALAESYTQSKSLAIASQYQNTFGVPVLFDKNIFPELLSIGDQSGARDVLRKMKSGLSLIPFLGGEIDLDTMDDYQKFLSNK